MGGETSKIEAERIGAMRVQTSAYGMVVPLAYGRTRITGNLIEYVDFRAIAHTETSGGKGGGGIEQTSYTYDAAVAMGLCEGPIIDVRAAWKGKEKVGDSVQLVFAEPHVVPLVAPYTVTIPDWAGGGWVIGDGFSMKPIFGGAVSGRAFTVVGGVYTFSSDMAGKTVYITYRKNIPAIMVLGFSKFLGTQPQAAWGYMQTAHPERALSYPGVAYVAASGYALNSSASLENHSFEVIAALPYNPAAGIWDANPAAVLTDFLTDPTHGAAPGFPVDSLSSFSDYCLSTGVLISPCWAEQRPAHEYIEELAQVGNSAPVWSEGKLKLIPYADAEIVGSLATYTPNVTPLYDLTDDDFLPMGGDPVKVRRKTQADAFNQVQVKFSNRAIDYNDDIAEAKDQADIEQHGLRPMSPVSLPSICEPGVADTVAGIIRDRALFVRNTYEFSVGWQYALLEPMDIVTVTDPALGLDKAPVRIREITEGAEITIVAEEFLSGVSAPTAYLSNIPAGYNADYNAQPGNVNTPVIFDAPSILTVTGREIWAAISGSGEEWGGCDVWVSTDNTTYKRVGSINGRARHGTLTAALAAGADPDTVNTLAVDLMQSSGELTGGTTADADLFSTLCWIEGELLSYRDAALTAANRYNLTYLRRGAYNSQSGAHDSGSRFVRCDDRLFKYAVDPALVGKVLYFKFTSFNQWGMGHEDLSAVTAYSHTVGAGASYPTNPTGFVASQNNNVVVFQWATPTDPNIVGADIRYIERGGTSWESASPITQVTKGTQITTAKVPPGDWTLMLAHRDNSGNYSRQPATYDLVVSNTFNIVAEVPQSPDWPGTLTNMVKHWTGVLVPDSQNLASADGWDTFDKFVANPYPLCYYEAPEIDIGFDARDRVWGDIVSLLPPTSTGIADPALEIDSRLAAGAYNGFHPWTIGTVDARFVKERIVVDTKVGVPLITGFVPTVDVEEFSQSGSATVGATGTTINYPERYHFPPTAGATAIGTSGLIATVSNITATGFDVHVFNTAGTEVGGDITWDATGA